MQVQQITVFLVACTLSVLVIAYAQDNADTVLLYRLRDLAARAAAAESPDLFADVDDYKRGGGKKNMGIHVHSGINFGKRRNSESSEGSRNSKRMRYHNGLSFGKRAPVQNWDPWQEQETYNPDWDLGQFN